MIPTLCKPKLPGFLVYPLGAATLSEALRESPRYDDLRLRFVGDAPRGTEEFAVVEGRYVRDRLGRSAARALEASGFYGPRWEIVVHAVPKACLASVRAALAEGGLSALRDWLARDRSETWLAQGRRCLVAFRPSTGDWRVEGDV